MLDLRVATLIALVLLVGTACSSSPRAVEPGSTPKTVSPAPLSLNPGGPKQAEIAPGYFDSVRSRDAIRPIYDPMVAGVNGAELQPDDLVIGVSLEGEFRAYPIVTLRTREMVNDELAGVPILVTW